MDRIHEIYMQNKMWNQEIILHLIEEAPYILNLQNASGKTALDLFLEQESSIDGKIRESFARSGARTGDSRLNSYLENFEDNRNSIMVAASIIASAAFTALINPPGGVWQDNSSDGPYPHIAGESVLAQTHPKQYNALVFYITTALISSNATILLHLISGVLMKRPFQRTMMLFIEIFAILVAGGSICVAGGYSFSSIVPESSKWHMKPPLVIPAIIACGILTPLFTYVGVNLTNIVVVLARWRLLKKRLTTTIPSPRV
ncbi:OLC1v1004928C2 [Oldenlandia corymbosa var. corymbosa]|uniref:OLC1v1004928C2 n=1 Tax=Oldenlandia corymbosa var. corymbosa TaxID=529605 RepID=A0AAV1DGE2_OLDCO|nr:OLC1v1004928C2 [Oldenlandia corymbosa var. corymbosa]